MKVSVEVSARHLHLCAEDCMTLFGKVELTKRNDLSEKGEYAAEEVVEVVGPKKSIHKVRVLGPLREKSQLEISRTDSFNLGIDAPLALSGSGKGCDIKIVGPKGNIISPIAMVAQRHLHAHPDFAKKYNLKNSDIVKLRIGGERSLLFENIIVRVADNFINNIHIDTDEGNAAGVEPGSKGEIITK